MPDLDIVERSLKKPWRAPYRLMKGGHPPEVVGEALVKALAASLRDDGGIPAVERVLDACMQAQSTGGSARTLAEMSRIIEQDFCQQKPVKLLARAAQMQFAEVEAGRALPEPVAVIERCLRSSLQHYFFARIASRLVGERRRFHNIQEARAFESSVWADISSQITRLARDLISDPTASKLRAPRSIRHRPTTADILEMPVGHGN